MEGELIFMSIVMLIGQVILLMMWNANWFKKENFKMQKTQVLAENRIKMKKLEKDLGLTYSKAATEEKSPLQSLTGLADLLPILKTLDPDQVGGLIDKFIGGDEPEASGGDSIDMLMDFAGKNPDIVKGLLEGIGKVKPGGSSEGVMDGNGY